MPTTSDRKRLMDDIRIKHEALHCYVCQNTGKSNWKSRNFL